MSAAFQEINQLIADYFDMLYHCDVEKLRQVFHPQAIYATADEADFLYRTMTDYASVIAARPAPAARGEARRDHVDAIDLAGDNTAFVRARCSIGTRDFVDFLTLVRLEGSWHIIAKVFQIIEREVA